MSSLRSTHVRRLFVASVCLFSIAVVLVCTVRQHARVLSPVAVGDSLSRALGGADKISPAAATIIVNSTADVANATDGLCTLREAIAAANNNVASGAVAGECAAGSSLG